MAVVCTECGGPHPKWECHATAARVAAYAVQRSTGSTEGRASETQSFELSRKVAVIAREAGIKPGPVDTNSFLTDADAWQAPIAVADEKKRGRPRIHADRNAYRAEWQRKRRLKLKEGK